MRRARTVLGVAVLLAAAALSPAHAITFQNITIAGDLSGGATYTTGDIFIDFFFPNAGVGDPFSKRFGEIVLTFEVLADSGLALNTDVVSILGGLSGSGLIEFNEVVEDLVNPGIIAKAQATLNDNSMLPYDKTIYFDRTSEHIKVKKSFLLSAEATANFDLAKVSFVEQTFGQIPEPGTMSLVGLAGLALLRRLKK